MTSAKVTPLPSATSNAQLTKVEQKTIIDGVCYDLTDFMHTHPG
jgi:cytochrome b involved in lipid metabolism